MMYLTQRHSQTSHCSAIHLCSAICEHTLRHRNAPTETTVTVRNVQSKSNFAQVGYGILMVNYTRTEGSAVETRTPAHWNLTGHSTTAPPLVLSPSNILPSTLLSLCFQSSKEKFGALLKSVIISFFKPFKIAYV